MSLLWEEETKAAKLKSIKLMRWHPVMIRWCISLYLKSPGGYESLRNSGFFILPTRATLDKYVNFTESRTGINPDVILFLPMGLIPNFFKLKVYIVPNL